MKKEISADTLFSILGYLPFFSIVIYVIREDSENIRFHAKQGVVIFAFYLLAIIPIPFVNLLLVTIGFILTLIGSSKAYKEEKYKIPYIYDLSKKINF